MTPHVAPMPARRKGFTLVEVVLAVGVIGIAFASLIGILTSSFQQVDDIMQTNRALTAAQGLVTALDNPRSILYDVKTATNSTSAGYLPSVAGLDNGTGDAPNFDLVYNLLRSADTPANGVWVYVYERKHVAPVGPTTSSGETNPMATVLYNIAGNPALIEVNRLSNDGPFTPDIATARNVIGTPMRVRLSLSRLLVGQRVTLDAATGEPTAAVYASGALPTADTYALAYLPIVAEFFPVEYGEDTATFKVSDQQPVLTQTIVINR